MQFSSFTRSKEENTIIFSSGVLYGVEYIKFYSDDASGLFSLKEFRWSRNGNYWSSWTELDQRSISSITIPEGSHLYLQVKYISTGGDVNSFSINYIGDEQPLSDDSSDSSSPDSTDTHNYSIDDSYEPSGIPYISGSGINASYLNSEPADFYLWRPNHKGTIPIAAVTNLQQTLIDLGNSIGRGALQYAFNVDRSGIGVFYEKDSQSLFFKNLIGGNKINIGEDAEGLITIAVDDSSISEIYQDIETINTDLSRSFGRFSQYSESLSESSTGLSTFENKAELVTPSNIPQSKYRIGWSFLLSNSGATDITEYRISVNGNSIEQSEISLPSANGYLSFSGFSHIDLSTGESVISIDFRAISGTALIKNAKIEFWLVEDIS